MPNPVIKKLSFILSEEIRLDLAVLNELKKEFPELSRKKLKDWFATGRVALNGRSAPPSELLPMGAHAVEISDFQITEAKPGVAAPSRHGCFLPIIYEDDNILVLNKRSGIPSVPHQLNETETAVGAALAYLPGLSEVGRGKDSSSNGYDPAILHRLDTGTSGLLVFAKTQKEFDRLQALWKTPAVKKTYRAVARASNAEELKFPQIIEVPIAHDEKTDKRMIAIIGEHIHFRGKALPAITKILQVTRISSEIRDIEVQIETGVMHQIRCHLAMLGWPILGDSIYSKGVPSSRLWLHAWKLELLLDSGSGTSKKLHLEAALPENWPTAPKSLKLS